MANDLPAFYIDNILLRAVAGSGDGTAYASGTAALCVRNRPPSLKPFYGVALTAGPIPDVGANVNGLFDGATLHFAATGDHIPILTWVAPITAGGTFTPNGERFTVSDPGAVDLQEGDFVTLTSGPNAGHSRALVWRSPARVDALNNGGFEYAGLGELPATEQAPGQWWGSASWRIVNADTGVPLIGGQSAELTVPGSGDHDIQQRGRMPLRAGRTYNLAVVARADASTAAGALRVLLINHATGAVLASSDVPVLSTAALGHAFQFAPVSDVADVRVVVRFVFANRGAATTITLDGVSAVEILPPGTLTAGPATLLTVEAPFPFPDSGGSYRRESRALLANVPDDLAIRGACTIIRDLVVPDLQTVESVVVTGAGQVGNLYDAMTGRRAKVRAANLALTVDVCLPNLIGQGGFEELAVGAFPSSQQGPGVWAGASADWTIVSSSALLGSRMALWTIGAGDGLFDQQITGVMMAGRRYRLAMKCEAVGGNPGSSGILQVKLSNLSDTVPVDADWNGSGVWNVPLTTTGAQWMSSDVVPDMTTDHVRLRIRSVKANQGAATSVRVDEVSLWEVVPVSSLLAFGHNWDGSPGPRVIGYRCPPDRSNIGAAEFVDLLAAASVSGSGPLLRTWTVADPPTGTQAFPIYRMTLAASASHQYEVGELLLGQTWPWRRAPDLGPDPHEREIHDVTTQTLSGATMTALFSSVRRFRGRVSVAPVADVTVWNGVFRERHIATGAPFGAYWPGIWDTPLFLRVDRDVRMPTTRSGARPDIQFNFREIVS